MSCPFCDPAKRGKKVWGHCPHWHDLTPDECGTCRDQKEVADLRTQLTTAQRERDEARASDTDYQIAIDERDHWQDQWAQAEVRWAQAERERDEARANLRREQARVQQIRDEYNTYMVEQLEGGGRYGPEALRRIGEVLDG